MENFEKRIITTKTTTSIIIIIIIIVIDISECKKISWEEYNTRYGWVGMVIHWEICKKFIFNHINI